MSPKAGPIFPSVVTATAIESNGSNPSNVSKNAVTKIMAR